MKKLFLSILLLSFISIVSAEDIQKSQTSEEMLPNVAFNATGQTLYVQNAMPGSLMEIYDIVGIKLVSLRIDSGEKTVTLALPKGYYILKIASTVKKIVIK